MAEISYRRHRFPPVVIQHAVWLYLRFTLSYRDVEELLAERGLDISYETVRCWLLKFGPVIARQLRCCRPRTSNRWHSPGGADRRAADVSVACRRSRGRGARHASSASPRQPGGTPADAQAAQETGLRAEIVGHRQAALLRLGVPAIRAVVSPPTRGSDKTIGRRTRIRRCDDANATCSGSSRRAPHSAFSACMPPSTTPSTSNAISSHAPRCGSSEPRQPTNGATRSPQRDRLLRFIPFSLVAINLRMRSHAKMASRPSNPGPTSRRCVTSTHFLPTRAGPGQVGIK